MIIFSARRAALVMAATLAATVPAAAQSPIALTSTIEAERSATDANGTKTLSYEAPKIVVPGDRLRFTLRMVNNGAAPAANVVINNPLPAEVAFETTPDLANFSVSVDGGKNFGDLAALTKAAADGTARPATADDVTNVRWVVASPVPPKGSYSIIFFGRVR